MTDPKTPQRALDTRDKEYTEAIVAREWRWWKRALGLQKPYRWNLRRLNPGFTLDIGCGVGRNLEHLSGNGVGIDHNPYSVAAARSCGFVAFTIAEFASSDFNQPGRFDSILLSHVVEHMSEAEAVAVVAQYRPLLKPGGKVIFFTPQERGFRSDGTHVRFVDFPALRAIARQCALEVVREISFPFPRWAGNVFIYNEFVSVGMMRDVLPQLSPKV
jgi:SAM-dependent methyltransferase